MNKHDETKKTDQYTNLETIETLQLDDVTGGCSRCGCGQPDAAAELPSQLAPSWPRR